MITKVTENKKQYLELLLLADEQEDMIDRYLERGALYVLTEGGVRCAAVVTEESPEICELKNIAVAPESQGQGYGQAMIRFLFDVYGKRYRTMLVGTGDVPRTTGFYQHCGFRESHQLPDFFTKHYHKPIVEDGILLKDMVYLRKDFERLG